MLFTSVHQVLPFTHRYNCLRDGFYGQVGVFSSTSALILTAEKASSPFHNAVSRAEVEKVPVQPSKKSDFKPDIPQQFVV